MNLRLDRPLSRKFFGVVIPTAVLMLGALEVLSGSAYAEGPQSATSRIVAAANAFLATLDDKQRAAVLFNFDDSEQRARWSNLPIGMSPRAGLSIGGMSESQRSAALALVASVLSRRGFEKVEQIRDADDVLKARGGDERE